MIKKLMFSVVLWKLLLLHYSFFYLWKWIVTIWQNSWCWLLFWITQNVRKNLQITIFLLKHIVSLWQKSLIVKIYLQKT